MASPLHDALLRLTKGSEELYLDEEILRISVPTPLEFLRDYVSRNRPVIITGATDSWPASFLWSNAYLRRKMGDREVTVAVTPTGRGDAIEGDMFVLPEERSMPFCELMDVFEEDSQEPSPHDACLPDNTTSGNTGDSSRITRAGNDAKESVRGSTASKVPNGSPSSPRGTSPERTLSRSSGTSHCATSGTESENPDTRTSASSDSRPKCASSSDGEVKNEVRSLSVHSPVYYVQKQNGYFPVEYPPLVDDVPKTISWADEAFGTECDAVNFWLGDDRAVSSMHQDPYENIYAVMAGAKHFTLIPPTDIPWLYRKKFRSAQYKQRQHTEGDSKCGMDSDKARFDIIPSEPAEHVEWLPMDPNEPDLGRFPMFANAHPNPSKKWLIMKARNYEEYKHVEWLPVDPNEPDLDRFPMFANAHPIRCTVNKGEILYLPALWFHEVRQGGVDTRENGKLTIAVNWWYDMRYDVTYNYHSFLDGLVRDVVPALEEEDELITKSAQTQRTGRSVSK